MPLNKINIIPKLRESKSRKSSTISSWFQLSRNLMIKALVLSVVISSLLKNTKWINYHRTRAKELWLPNLSSRIHQISTHWTFTTTPKRETSLAKAQLFSIKIQILLIVPETLSPIGVTLPSLRTHLQTTTIPNINSDLCIMHNT